MLRRKTVFIVGAGASKEFDLPLGYELGKKIETLLNIKFEQAGVRDKLASGDADIVEALHRYRQGRPETSLAPWLQACKRIRQALPHHHSIDNLIDNHAGDEKIDLVGKLGIAKALLAAERASKLWFDPTNTRNEIRFRSVEDTWLAILFLMLQAGVHRSKAASFFKNVEIVTFNYDRCIEHYLYLALQQAYGISDGEAGAIVSAAAIHHVYGSVGPLPWQQANNAIPFGGVEDVSLLQSVESLRTYSEQQSDTKERDEIQGLLADSDAIVFLGFGFIPTNMSLLRPPRKLRANLVIGSALGLSKFNARHVEKELAAWFEAQTYRRDLATLDENATAASLLTDYGRAFV